MRLVSCHIENFGKLQDFDYNFDEEKSIIHEENGWGKSTFATFIRVMFYGFIGENKRTIVDNERKKYKPWQMGVYGGNIVFCVNGKEYRMERRFGEKKSGTDEFSLFDNVTNLKSDDYSTNIGEEIFGIDIESFMRTVFIAQQECGTDVTPNISAKIGNVSDQTADMGNYDAVQNSIKKEMDRITPDRATGLLSKMRMTITELREKIRNKEHYVNNFNELSKRLEEQVLEKEEQVNEQKKIQEDLKRISAIKDSQAGAEKYKELCEQEELAKEKYANSISFFPNGLPEKAEIENVIKQCDEYDNQVQISKRFSLSDTEDAKKRALEECFRSGIPEEELLDKIQDDIDKLAVLESERDSNLLSESERRKLEEAKKLFANYKPTIEAIDSLSNEWSERRSKKEALSTKKANAELVRSTHISDGKSTVLHKKHELVVLSIGIVAILCGLAMLVAKVNMAICMGVFVIGVVSLIVAGLLFLSSSAGKKGDNQRNEAYDQIVRDIGEDERFIKRVENSCLEMFRKLDIEYSEYGVPAELSKIRELLKDYDELVARTETKEALERETNIKRLYEDVLGFLGKYHVCDELTDLRRVFFELRRDVTEYSIYMDKVKKKNDAEDESKLIKNEIIKYLDSLGIEPSDDLKDQLTDINEKCISLEYAKNDLEQKTKRKEEFEKENDISKYVEDNESTNIMSMEDLSKAFNELKTKIDEIDELEDRFREQMDEVAQKLEEIESDEAELLNLEEEYKSLSKKFRIMGKTKEYLEKAKQNFSSKYMDDIQNAFEKYHNIISNSEEKYELDANLNIKLREKGSLHEIAYLSEGYQDLVGLCRRMAMVDAMYDLEKPFLIFDDPFVNLDDSRLAGAMNFLDGLTREYQVIYFSCHNSRC